MQPLLFSSMNLSAPLHQALDKMGYTTATPIQALSIPPILDGKDLIALAPTGTGKTCSFGIPLVQQVDPQQPGIQAVVLCPTRELAMQTARELTLLAQYKPGVRVVSVYGGQPIERQIQHLRRKPQIIVATPGRMMDHMRRKTIKVHQVRMVVMDEADEMLNMGFRDDMHTILKKTPGARQTLLFSATMSPAIREIATEFQHDAACVEVERPKLDIPPITQYSLELPHGGKFAALTHILREEGYVLCLVFCNTKRMVDDLVKQLARAQFSAEGLHGDMKQRQRDAVMQAYRRGKIQVLVATDVAARGIDVHNIQAVFNYDVPRDDESYVHRIGRTGRLDQTGVSYTFICGAERKRLNEIMQYTKAPIEPLWIDGITLSAALSGSKGRTPKRNAPRADRKKTQSANRSSHTRPASKQSAFAVQATDHRRKNWDDAVVPARTFDQIKQGKPYFVRTEEAGVHPARRYDAKPRGKHGAANKQNASQHPSEKAARETPFYSKFEKKGKNKKKAR